MESGAGEGEETGGGVGCSDRPGAARALRRGIARAAFGFGKDCRAMGLQGHNCKGQRVQGDRVRYSVWAKDQGQGTGAAALGSKAQIRAIH